jgi:FkbM family methyltransferase
MSRADEAASARRELTGLLSEPVAECRHRESTTFDELSGDLRGAPLVLLGAGGLGRLVTKLARQNGDQVLAFCDNAQRLWGTEVEGLPVLSPAEAADLYGDDAIFVVTIWAAFVPGTMSDRIAQLTSLGCRCVLPFQYYLWKHPHALPYFNVDLPSRLLQHRDEVGACMNLWSDDDSTIEYTAQVRARLTACFDDIAPSDSNGQYYPSDLLQFRDDEVFVDVGAFDGDSLESFINVASGRFRRAIAFEPDPDNFARLCARPSLAPDQSRLDLRRQAVTDTSGVVSFLTGQEMSSRMGGGGVDVPAVTLDSLLDEGVVPTFVKFDVEGFEPEAIGGAAHTIAEHQPALAICVYHKQDHLWTLPLSVHRMNPHYRFHLRPYGFIWEEVCYAIPPHRGVA